MKKKIFIIPGVLIFVFTIINVISVYTGHDEALGIEMIILGLPLTLLIPGVGPPIGKIGFWEWYILLCVVFYINLSIEIYLVCKFLNFINKKNDNKAKE